MTSLKLAYFLMAESRKEEVSLLKRDLKII